MKTYLQFRDTSLHSLDWEGVLLAANEDEAWRAPLWLGTRLLDTFCTDQQQKVVLFNKLIRWQRSYSTSDTIRQSVLSDDFTKFKNKFNTNTGKNSHASGKLRYVFPCLEVWTVRKPVSVLSPWLICRLPVLETTTTVVTSDIIIRTWQTNKQC